MHKSISLLIVVFVLTSCSFRKKPEFIKIENIEIVDSNDEFITLSANAFFKNPNNVGGTLATDDISIFVNDILMAQVASKAFDVPARKEFSVPLQAIIPTQRLLNKNNLDGLLTSLFSQKIKVHYKGVIDYKILGFTDQYIVDRIEDIKIKF